MGQSVADTRVGVYKRTSMQHKPIWLSSHSCSPAPWLASSVTPAGPASTRTSAFAVYCVVDATQRFADEKVVQAEFDRVMARVKFDKVYLEVYRNKRFADEASLDIDQEILHRACVIVEGGLTLAAGAQAGNSAPSTSRNPRPS